MNIVLHSLSLYFVRVKWFLMDPDSRSIQICIRIKIQGNDTDPVSPDLQHWWGAPNQFRSFNAASNHPKSRAHS